MKIAIVTDTNSGITKHDTTGNNIYVLQVPIVANEKDLIDYDSVSHSKINNMIADPKINLTTTHVSAVKIKELWNTLIKKYHYDYIIHIAPSSKIDNNFDMLTAISENYNGKVFLCDSHRIGVSLKSLVFSAKKMTEKGIIPADIYKNINNMCEKFVSYIIVEEPRQVKQFCKFNLNDHAKFVLNSNYPILNLTQGELNGVTRCKKFAVSKKILLKHLDKDIKTKFSKSQKFEIFIAYAGDIEQGIEMKTILSKKYPDASINYLDALSFSLMCNLGKNCLIVGASEKF